jgi:hypothetical protein
VGCAEASAYEEPPKVALESLLLPRNDHTVHAARVEARSTQARSRDEIGREFGVSVGRYGNDAPRREIYTDERPLLDLLGLRRIIRNTQDTMTEYSAHRSQKIDPLQASPRIALDPHRPAATKVSPRDFDALKGLQRTLSNAYATTIVERKPLVAQGLQALLDLANEALPIPGHRQEAICDLVGHRTASQRERVEQGPVQCA